MLRTMNYIIYTRHQIIQNACIIICRYCIICRTGVSNSAVVYPFSLFNGKYCKLTIVKYFIGIRYKLFCVFRVIFTLLRCVGGDDCWASSRDRLKTTTRTFLYGFKCTYYNTITIYWYLYTYVYMCTRTQLVIN